MKKILLSESEKKAIILEREKAILDSFKETFNKIKRVDENGISEMERFDATTYQEKNNWNPTPHGDKYNVQYEILYCDSSTCGKHMFHTVNVYANSEEEAIKLGNKEIKVWGHNHAFNGAANEFDSETGEPNFKIESFQLYAIENESELDMGSIDENNDEDYERASREVEYGINPNEDQSEIDNDEDEKDAE